MESFQTISIIIEEMLALDKIMNVPTSPLSMDDSIIAWAIDV
jgi:hypothetical protein